MGRQRLGWPALIARFSLLAGIATLSLPAASTTGTREPVRSYDTKWLAYVREHQLQRLRRPSKTDHPHGSN